MKKRAKQARKSMLEQASSIAQAQATDDWRIFTKASSQIKVVKKREKKAIQKELKKH